MNSPESPAIEVPGSNHARWRWWGAALGLGTGVADAIGMQALGVSFTALDSDVTLLVGAYFGLTFALLGYLLGFTIEARRRDRQTAALLQAQMESLDALRLKLAQSEKLAALGQLAATIAHEVRNPLAVIRSAAQEVAQTIPADELESRRACSFIGAEIDRLNNVISSLLAFARPLRLSPCQVAVGEIFDTALLLARAELDGSAVRVSRLDARDLPPVQADRDLLGQVLLGLIANAVESMGNGGQVGLEAHASNGTVEIAVADSGPGVPAELRSRIFEPFFTTRERGTGLGLAIARQIIEAHGGRIEVGDRPGGGARFAIRLPVAVGAASSA